MKIGNNELSDSELKLCRIFAADILNQAKKQFISALNIKTKDEDVAVLLHEIWSTREIEIVKEPTHEDMEASVGTSKKSGKEDTWKTV